ncbi:PAS domain S-box protein [Gracilimonas sp.]|uniref:PAS domain S-box protein n=1 Tax=Gracilimonas sp. TaxID=1974203 RepID=UPI0032EE57B1
MSDNIYTTIELNALSSAILNSLNAHIAILDYDGTITAFNKQWKIQREEFGEKCSHPNLNENILSTLQQPLADGNDFALRLLLGIKDVLHQERDSFETKYQIQQNGSRKTFNVTVKSLGPEDGAILIYEDISAQIQSLTYLKETQEKFEKHFHNSLYGILVADESNIVIEANNVACKMLETTSDAIVFSNITNYLDVDMDASEIQKRINREGNFMGEYEITTANGSIVPVELSVTLFRSENGKPVTSWAFKDISQKRLTQQALKASEQQYKLQFNNTLEGTIIGRPNGRILTVNPAACDLLGYKAEELEGQYRDIVFDMGNPINVQAVANRRENGSFTGEVEFTHKDGHKIPVEVSSVIFEAEDGTEKTIINIKDISSRKAVQQQLLDEKEFTESAISSLPTAFFVFSLDGTMVRWNSMLEQDLGYTHDEIAHSNVIQLVHPDDQPLLKEIMKGELVGRKISVEARCITKEGKAVHYLLRGTSFEQNGERFIVGGGLNRNNLIEIENERQLVKEELQRTKHFNELAVNGANLGLWEVDLDSGHAYYNERWHTMLGYRKEDIEFTREFFYTLIHPEDESIPENELARYKEANDKYESEFRLKAADGSYKWILAIAKFVDWDENGKPTKLAGSHMDITDRKVVEVQNKRHQQLLNQLFFNSPIGIVLVDAEGRVQNINQSFSKIFGYSEKEIAGKDLDQTIVPSAMDDQGEILSQLSFTGDSFQTETIRITKDGKEVPVLVGGVPVELDGEVIAIYGMYVDISERKSKEEELKKVNEQLEQAQKVSKLGYWAHKIAENTTKWSKEMYNIWELDPKTFNPNFERFKETIHPEDKHLVSVLTDNSFQDQKYHDIEYRIVTSSGKIKWIFERITVIKNDQGEPVIWEGISQDITERKALENRIVDLLKTEQKARAQMQDMFEESPSAIAMLEGDQHTYTFVNDKYKELVGRNHLVGLPVKEALPEMAEQGFTDLLNTCFSEDRTLYFNEKEIYFNRGENQPSESYFLNFVYKPIHDENGKVYGIFVEAIDVTEQVQARNIIEKSLAEKETLLNEVHHRVKNNLAIISGLLELEILDNHDQKISKHLYSTQSRITTIAKIHELLYQNESLTHVSFKKFIESVMGEGAKLTDKNSYKLISGFELDEVELNVNQAIPAGMLLNEVLDYLDQVKSSDLNADASPLTLKMVNNNDECVKIELIDQSNQLLPAYNTDDNSNTRLRKELIEVLSTQIHGNIELNQDKESILSIHFAKREAKGPHSALRN